MIVTWVEFKYEKINFQPMNFSKFLTLRVSVSLAMYTFKP